MPNIVIREIDETKAGSPAASTDIAYVPGFAATNANVYIYSVSGVAPTAATKGTKAKKDDTYHTIGNQYPSFACNIIDKTTWKCTADDTTYTWVEQTYVEPAPENTPVLCNNLMEFEEAFGVMPYQWVKGYKYDTTERDWVAENNTDFANRVAYPNFDEGALPSADAKAYVLNDYEKSYIYAKELVALGLPIIYENIVERATDGRKVEPSVIYLYEQLPDCYDNLKDKGEYTVKYLTSGVYPTFEYDGTYGYEVEETRTDSISSAAYDGSESTYEVPLETLTKSDGEVWYPESVTLNITYIPEGSSVTRTKKIVLLANYEGDPSNPNPEYDYIEGGTYNWGGTGNSICLTLGEDSEENTVPVIHFNVSTPWTWTSATYTAVYKETVTEEGGNLIYSKMITTAAERGDCVAIIDHTNNPARRLVGSGSVYETVKATSISNAEFATMFTPWATYQTVYEANKVPTVQLLPASFAYLTSLAKSLKTNANWLAIAGVARGLVPYIVSLNTVDRLTNTIANSYQPRDGVSINPITLIKPYGLTIWGNRTLKDNSANGNLTATSFLNTRNTVSDVKKVAYTTAKSLLFEQNSNVLWINFKTGIMPLLDQMVTGQGLSGYKIIKGTTTEKAKVVAIIRLYPLYAVEDFDITVRISDEDVAVS